jgi:hypothetical protein
MSAIRHSVATVEVTAAGPAKRATSPAKRAKAKA